MSLVDQTLDFNTLVFSCCSAIWLVRLNKDINGSLRSTICLVEQQLELLLIVLEATDEIQVFVLVELTQHLSQFYMEGTWCK